MTPAAPRGGVSGWVSRRREVLHHRGEEGVSLILVLVVVIVLALIVGAILSQAQALFTSTAGGANIRNLTYAADGGIEYGIEQARSGYCHSPSTASPPALTQLAPGETNAGAVTFDEPSVNPSVTVSCETTTGNSLTNTYGGSEGNPGYSLITNSPTTGGCVSLATDAVGQQPNQIKYNATSRCATYANAAAPDLWTAANAPALSPIPNLTSVYYLDANDAWAVGNNTSILYFDGSQWSQQTCASCATDYNLSYVFATDPNDVWAVGNEAGTPKVLYFDGTTWSVLNTNGAIPNNTTLTSAWGAIGGSGSQALWIVGFNGPNAVAYQLVEGGSGQCDGGGSNVCTIAAETLPTGTQPLLDVTGVAGASAYDLWAVGKGGTILASPDGGTTWSAQSSNTSQQLNSVFALSTTSVWAAGNGSTIDSTGDGGTTWSAGSFGTGEQLNEIWGDPTTSDIWIVGQGPDTIYFYDGSTWSTESGPTSNQNLTAISGIGTGIDQAIVVGQNQTMWLFNGLPNNAGTPSNNGPPWVQQVSGTTQQLNATSGVPGTNDVWAVGNPQGPKETILSTTNGGSTWTPASVTIAKPQPLLGVSAADANDVWAVGGQGQILYFHNGSWTQQTSGTTQQLNAVFALDAQHVWAVGNPAGSKYTIVSTSNGGATWTASTLTGAKTQPLFGVWAADATHVWAVGGQGLILNCTSSCNSAGAAWPTQSSGTTQQLNGISGISAAQVWVVGKNAPLPAGTKPAPGGPNGTETILTNLSGTWKSVGPAVAGAQPLQGVFAQLNSATPNVFAVGGNGSIWFSSDGTTWAQQLGGATKVGGKKPPPGGGLRGVTAVGTGIGQAWAVGNGGAIWNFNPYAETGMAIDSGGPVFNAGNVQASSVFWASDSDFTQGGTGTCSPNPGIANLYVNGTYGCTATTQATASKTLPSSPGSLYGWGGCTPSPTHTYSAGCKKNPKPPITKPVAGCNLVQFTPGIYQGALNLNANNTTYFFPSGIYYFDNVGNIPVNGTSGKTNGTFVIGGTPVSLGTNPASYEESTAIASQSPCWSYIVGASGDEANDPGYTAGGANGVEFIMGGNSALQIQKGNVELFSRMGANPTASWTGGTGTWGPDGSRAVSLREACSPAGTGLSAPVDCASAWDPTNIGGNGQIITFAGTPPPPPGGTPTGPEVDIHGSIYAPDANVDLYSETNAANLPTAVGAVDAWSLEVGESSYSAPAVEIAGGGPFAARTIVFTAFAQGGGGNTPVQEEAQVSLGSPGTDPVADIETWRSCQPATGAGQACGVTGAPSSTTSTTTVAGVAGLGFTSVVHSGTGNTYTCSSPPSQNVTCTIDKLGGTGSFSANVTLENSSGAPVTNNSGTNLPVSCTETTVQGSGATVSPPSSVIANGASSSSSAFTLQGISAGWQATMTCSVPINGTTYTIAVTGH